MSTETTNPTPSETDILRGLAERKLQIASDPANRERRSLWHRHDAGDGGGRPLVLAEFQGLRDGLRPVTDDHLECETAWARGVERELRCEIYRFDELQDDHVVEPCINTPWHVESSDYGVEVVHHHPEFEGTLGARRWDSPIEDLDRDLDKLHPRTWSVDREATQAQKAQLEQVFEDLLPVRIRGGFWWTMGMTWPAIELIGLEQLMLAMYDNPDGLHALMGFLRDDHLASARRLEGEGVLSLNNENDYIGSGSMGYTRDLPQTPADDAVRRRDMWVLLESQETVGVSPELFEEFIFPYQAAIGAEFGKVYYGCCEPVHTRMNVLERLPNLARVSVSPWADEEAMAEKLGNDIVFSRKPSPTLISTEHFDEEAIRADLRHTLDVARNCRLELIMKDVHTLCEEPWRLPRWVAIAREEIDRGSVA